MVTVGPAHVAADTAGVPWHRGQSRKGGEPVSGSEDVEVAAGRGDELGAEQGPMPGMLRITVACGWSWNRASMSASRSVISSFSTRIPFARRATVAAAGFSPGRAVCWAWAASRAVWASKAAPLTLRFFSQASMRLAPDRPDGVLVRGDQPRDHRHHGARRRRHDDQRPTDPQGLVAAPPSDLSQLLSLFIGQPPSYDRLCRLRPTLDRGSWCNRE